MISERRQIAERFLSEGNGEAARIRGNRVRDLNKIQSEAYRQVEEIRGVADAKATEIYSKAYNQNAESATFYEFTRTMQAYKQMIGENTTLILSTDSDVFKFLKGMNPMIFLRREMAVPNENPIGFRRVKFRHPFKLKGVEGDQLPGTYSVEVRDERSGWLKFLKIASVSTWIGLIISTASTGPLRTSAYYPAILRPRSAETSSLG
jgi:hypothetical protein